MAACRSAEYQPQRSTAADAARLAAVIERCGRPGTGGRGWGAARGGSGTSLWPSAEAQPLVVVCYEPAMAQMRSQLALASHELKTLQSSMLLVISAPAGEVGKEEATGLPLFEHLL